MTFGEKLKKARKEAGLLQEQLAEQMGVSRSAIAKWETDKGLPDIENLKMISKLLTVSVDYLLDDGSDLDLSVTREPIDLAQYGKGRKKVIKDKIVRAKYPDAQIIALMAREKLTNGEKFADTAVFLLSPLVGTMALAKAIDNLENEFYLVNQESKQYLVVVTNEFIESRLLAKPIEEKKFEIGNYHFINCGPIKYA